MAGVITHIFVADLLVKKGIVDVSNRSKYLLGSIAPDSIMSKEDYHRDDKKMSHLREGISSDDWYLDEFKELFKKRVKKFYNANDNDDFTLGYMIHILTDQAFHYTFRREIIRLLKENNRPFTGRELMFAMVNELDALDYVLLKDNLSLYKELLLSKNLCSKYKLDKIIDSKSLCSNFEWIESKFSQTSNPVEFLYFDSDEMDELFNQVTVYIKHTLSEIGY